MNCARKHKTFINESILMDTLPSDIVTSVLTNNTSLGNNPAIPDIYDKPFISKILHVRFDEIKNKLKEIGSIDDIKSDNLYSALSELISKCKEIEKPYRDKLTKICYNHVVELFSIPEECIILNMELNDSIDFSKSNINLSPIENDNEIENLQSGYKIKKEIYKRRLLNTLCMGGGIELFKSTFNIIKNDINDIDPNLSILYKQILLINDYLLLIKEEIDLTDENKKQLGTVEVNLGNDELKTTINSQGVIFPILLIETIRGLLELFISHGLPKDKQTALTVINNSDFLKAEPWDMRIGPELWKLLARSFNDINSNEIPYLIKRISQLDVDKFNFLMKEVFAKTRKGKEIMSFICNKAKNDMDYNRFINKMDKMRVNKTVITDEFIHLDEL